MLSCPELLSPAGSLEALKYAVMYGADAVYCALPRFGMRAAPVNLTIGELHDGCIFAHARGKKVYLCIFPPRQASPIMLLQPWPTTWVPSVWCWRAS